MFSRASIDFGVIIVPGIRVSLYSDDRGAPAVSTCVSVVDYLDGSITGLGQCG